MRRKYKQRVLKLKQEWTTSVVGGGELQIGAPSIKLTISCGSLYYYVAAGGHSGRQEVHLAAVGEAEHEAERELQAVAHALSPDGRALMVTLMGAGGNVPSRPMKGTSSPLSSSFPAV